MGKRPKPISDEVFRQICDTKWARASIVPEAIPELTNNIPGEKLNTVIVSGNCFDPVNTLDEDGNPIEMYGGIDVIRNELKPKPGEPEYNRDHYSVVSGICGPMVLGPQETVEHWSDTLPETDYEIWDLSFPDKLD